MAKPFRNRRVKFMNRYVYFILFCAFLILASITQPSIAGTEEDACIEKGVAVKNLTTIDLWYKRKDGVCFKWKQNKIFFVSTGDSIELFSDMICKTRYCNRSMNYAFCRSFDADNNCRIKILPGCNITDM